MGLENEGIFEPNICLFCREQARLVFRNERYYYRRTCDACGKSIISVYNPETVSNVFCHACWWSDKWSATTYGREYDPDVPFFSQYKELLAATPKLAMMNDNGSGSENCEYTYDFAYGKNVYLVVGAWHTRDSMYGYQINRVKSCIDNDWVNESEYMYNCIACERCYGLQECMQCYESRDCVFGFDLIGCQDCLFCAGIRHKQYCIRNVQYTREEYLRKKNSLELGNWGKRESYHVEFLKFIRDVPRKYAHLVRCENCTGDYLVNSRNSFECFFQRNLHGCKWMTSGDGAKDSYECYSTGDPELCYNCITPDNSYGVAFSIFCWKSQYVLYSDNCHSSHHLFGCI